MLEHFSTCKSCSISEARQRLLFTLSHAYKLAWHFFIGPVIPLLDWQNYNNCFQAFIGSPSSSLDNPLYYEEDLKIESVMGGWKLTNTYSADFLPNSQMKFCFLCSVWQVAVTCCSPVRAIKFKFSWNLNYTKEWKKPPNANKKSHLLAGWKYT